MRPLGVATFIWACSIGANVLAQGSEIRLTSGAGVRANLRWFPDGRWLLYTRSDGSPGRLWKVPVDGGPEVQVTTDQLACVQDISPDGQYIVYSNFPFVGLVRVRADGTKRTALLGSQWGACSPIWSPDGRVIAATATLPGGSSGLVIVDAVNGGPTAQFPNVGASGQRWSPRGDAVLYSLLTPPGAPNRLLQIFRLEYPSGVLAPLTSPPQWHLMTEASPDGAWLALQFALPMESRPHVGVIPITGGTLTEVGNPGGRFLAPYGWHPSSDSLAVIEDTVTTRRLLRMLVPGGQEVELLPHGERLVDPVFSPDGNYIAYPKPDPPTGAIQIFRLAVAGPPTPAVVGSGRVGTDIQVHFHAVGEPGVPYVAAASFSSVPGIPVGSRTIPLFPDPLLILSLIGGGTFEGFIGTLDASARAQGVVHLPGIGELAGLRFWIAFVTLSPSAPSGIRTISAPRAVFLFS